MPSGLEVQYYGVEPTWEGLQFQDKDADHRLAICKALHWYSSMSSDEERKRWLLEYIKKNEFPEDTYDIVKSVPSTNITIRYGQIDGVMGYNTGAVARLFNLGAPMDEKRRTELHGMISYFVSRYNIKKETLSAAPKRDVQKSIDANNSKIIGTLESFYDDVLYPKTTHSLSDGVIPKKSKKKSEPEQDKYTLFKESIKSLYCSDIIAHFKPVLEEITGVVSKSDAGIAEGYQNVHPEQLRNAKNFLQDLIKFCQDRIADKKQSSSFRKKTRKSPIDQVSKMIFLKEDTTSPLKLKSILPSKIIGAQKVCTYNLKTRMFTIYETNSSEGLAVKGTTLLYFDNTKSKSKKIRSPEKFFKEIQGQGIRVVKTQFDGLSTTESVPNGRINKDTILYEVF